MCSCTADWCMPARLPKPINEVVIHEKTRAEAAPADPSFWFNWGWMCLLGLGMVLGGVLAWIIAATSVVLPYDIAFLGMDAALLVQANPLVLQFMSHDRVTLAGTMISIGLLYFQLSYYGLRKGLHWAKTALMTSCLFGLLLPMFILSMRKHTELPSYNKPNLRDDRIWLRAQWGQLMFVVLGFSLAIGGIVISVVGITHVFVPQDLTYLCATPDMLRAINERLLPLIAHDRAGFGGALFADALAILTAGYGE
jgi:dihydroorotate dehydrogenase